MKKQINIVIILSITFFLTVGLLTFTKNLRAENYPVTVIGIIDINLLLIESKASKNANKQLEIITKDLEEKFKITDNEILNEQNKLIEAQSVMAPEAFEVKRIEYEKIVRDAQILRQKKLVAMDNLVIDTRNKILENIRPILEAIAEEKGITVILDKGAGTVVLNADNMDLTKQVLKQLDKELPKLKIDFKE
jgi:Skp family chaperone for outer membrane proteins